ncbi:hypothetical protein MM239_07535 [Belliella sp. DSM 111904]|uniref:Uncharacterized protein n=1 Tax=Belliella filtrata TaxID=2923435 RepID=A0ABS9UZQ2_9BACT|nr:hypothetical protein [Belliella filtrata]MCH7409240.1 hypothetical protein [Belliella filtrata]
MKNLSKILSFTKIKRISDCLLFKSTPFLGFTNTRIMPFIPHRHKKTPKGNESLGVPKRYWQFQAASP